MDLLRDDYRPLAGGDGALLIQMDYLFSDAQLRYVVGQLARLDVASILVLTPSVLRLSPRALAGQMARAIAANRGAPRITYRRTVAKLASLFEPFYRREASVCYAVMNRPTWVLEFHRRSAR